MLVTKFGSFNGISWDELCQQVFKRKYEADGYQQMQASPGDFGIEGFTIVTGWAFQCYCPDKHYKRSELYDKIRDKITLDLGKLAAYEHDLAARLGQTKISRWIFVTPEVDKNAIIAHARKKEKEVRAQKLSFIAQDFSILVYDGDHFLLEINEIRAAAGEALIFDDQVPALAELKGEQEKYEKNVLRKCSMRLAHKSGHPNFQAHLAQLSQLTIESFLTADGYFKRIEATAPTMFVKLIRIINEYEQYVIETSTTWSGSAENLTAKIRDGLADRITQELSPHIDLTDANKVARHMTARWLAKCDLNYD